MSAAQASQHALRLALFVVRLAFPILLLATSASLFLLKAPSPPTSPSPITSVIVSVITPRRSLIISLLSLIALDYFLDGLALVVHSVVSKTWQGTPVSGDAWVSVWGGLEVETLVGLLATSLLAIGGVWKEVRGVNVWLKKRVKAWTALAVIGTIVEIVLICLTVDFLRHEPIHIPELPPVTTASIPTILHLIFPILRLFVLIPLYAALAYPRVSYIPATQAQDRENGTLTEDSSLLVPASESAVPSQGLNPTSTNAQYGTFRAPGATSGFNTRSQTPVPIDVAQGTQSMKPDNATSMPSKSAAKIENPTWSEMFHRLMKIAPYLWPKKSAWLQFLGFLCVIVLVTGRIVNAAVPMTLGALLRIFETQYSDEVPPPQPVSPWPYLLAYVGLRFLQSSGGLGALRDTLWAPVMQYSDREMSQMTFSHLLSLSLSFHTRRKTGEILRILDRGAAINRIFELLLFNICPTFVDMLVILIIFIYKFGWELALVVAFVMFAYITASIVLTTWRTRLRREMNDRDVITRGIHTDSLLNYETVKYFSGEAFENDRYSDAIRQYQSLEYRVIVSLNLLNLVQNFIISIGLLVGSMIVALRVSRREAYPSDFVVFITYLAQLYGPLNMLGYIYRSINTSLVDAERLLKLLEEPTDVNDKPGAPDLIVDDGEIEFDNVSFSYDGRTTALNGVSFKVPKGSSVALVGESGSGKSTVLRLLYRFYDLKEGEGRILIDGKDIRDVTQLSLRKAIGVVPQDSVLFNASIGYNIGYGKFGATPEELEIAAKAAQMHDRIMTFPDGYETKVGERGVRLSGGEKQRVAIARTLLKNPPILLLDEATSALDTSTEKDIQKALQNLVKGRSSLSIAHRLSTISSADLILVLKEGQIVEQGSHRELLAMDGIFAAMWADQVSADERAPSIADRSTDKKEVTGYSVEENVSRPVAEEQEPSAEVVPPSQEESTRIPADSHEAPSAEVETPAHEDAQPPSDQPASVEPSQEIAQHQPLSYAAAAATTPSASAPVVDHAPAPAPPAGGPIAFPTSDTASQQTPSIVESTHAPGPAVTFGTSVDTPPSHSRSGTPDPSAEPKRKRISSQNFQRLARRISFGTKRQGSVSSIPVPSLKRDESETGASRDEGSARGEGSVRGEVDSPSGSIIQGEDGKKAKKEREKKEKKDKKRKTSK